MNNKSGIQYAYDKWRAGRLFRVDTVRAAHAVAAAEYRHDRGFQLPIHRMVGAQAS
jgi:hypothetical protein